MAAAPVLSTLGLAAGVLLDCPDAGPVRRALAGIADGAAAALIGHEPAADSPLRVEDGRVTGSAGFVLDAEKADLLVALAEGAEGGCVLVLRREEIVVEQTAAVEPERPLATVHCDLAVPADAVVPLPRESALAAARLAIAAELVGVASATLELGVEYAGQRIQFGRTIGEFQAVQHRLASVYVLVERARGVVASAAVAHAGGASSEERRLASLVAKAAASDAALATLNSVVQVHGAIGTTAEHVLHRFMRRIWQDAALLGEAHELYAEIGAHAGAAVREGAGWGWW
jgi:alkylation response protein AidB-like acyl-CoA dehydrogenase